MSACTIYFKKPESLAYIFVAGVMYVRVCTGLFYYCRYRSNITPITDYRCMKRAVGSKRRIASAPECVLAVQGHLRSMILVPIESAYATSY